MQIWKQCCLGNNHSLFFPQPAIWLNYKQKICWNRGSSSFLYMLNSLIYNIEVRFLWYGEQNVHKKLTDNLINISQSPEKDDY